MIINKIIIIIHSNGTYSNDGEAVFFLNTTKIQSLLLQHPHGHSSGRGIRERERGGEIFVGTSTFSRIRKYIFKVYVFLYDVKYTFIYLSCEYNVRYRDERLKEEIAIFDESFAFIR